MDGGRMFVYEVWGPEGEESLGLWREAGLG